MAFRWMDGFDCYATGHLDEVGYSSFAGGSAIDTAVSRFGTSALKALDSSNSIDRLFDAQATWIVGGGFRMNGLPSGYYCPFAWLDAGTLQIDLRINSTGHLYVTRNGTQLGSAGSSVLAINQWYHLQFKVTIHDSTGIAEVLLNGVAEITLSGQDTKNTANATADKLRMFSGSGGNANWIDDLYVCDGTGGGTYADFLGDLRIESILPNGNGTTSNLVGNDGNSTDNYLLVDEATPNDDTDYVESSTVGDKDTYNYGALTSATGSVLGVMPMLYSRKTDAGVRSLKSVVRVSGTEEDSAAQTLNASYLYQSDIRTTKPGGGAFSIADVAGMEVGAKVAA